MLNNADYKPENNNVIYKPEDEKVIKKNWLNAFLIYVIFSFCSIPIEVVTGLYLGDEKVPELISFLVVSAFIYSLSVLTFWLIYHFGYKKRGTFFLALSIFLGGFKFISEPLKSLPGWYNILIEYGLDSPLINFFLSLEICGIAIGSYYLFHCYRLYKLNSAYKKSVNRKK